MGRPQRTAKILNIVSWLQIPTLACVANPVETLVLAEDYRMCRVSQPPSRPVPTTQKVGTRPERQAKFTGMIALC